MEEKPACPGAPSIRVDLPSSEATWPDKQPFNILGLMPNPTSDLAQLQFEVSEAQRLTIRLHSMEGTFLDDIFDGTVEPGAVYQVNISAGSLASGLYQLRISGGEHSEVRKLLVTE